MSTSSLYNRLYKNPSYNPKEDFKVQFVLDWIEQNGLKGLLDVGCGRGHYLVATGAMGLEPSDYLCKNDLSNFAVVNTTIQDFNTTRKWDGLYCMDVLEHISHNDINTCLERLRKLAPKALYGIANHPDCQAGVELHLIQENVGWWAEKLAKYYKNVRLTYEPLRYMVFECSQ